MTQQEKGKAHRACWITNYDKWPHSETFLYDPTRIGHYQTTTHFIEYAALEEAKAEIERLKEENYQVRCQKQSKINDIEQLNFDHDNEVQSLKDRLKRAYTGITKATMYLKDHGHTNEAHKIEMMFATAQLRDAERRE